jgi:ubiquitin carboxyl-terminal hydrolase 25
MDNKREDKTPRRRLPSPNESAQGNESAANDIPVPPTDFYSSNKPPPLPSRPIAIPTGSAGSSHTRYYPPPSSPTGAGEGTPFREPELVADEPISDDEVPALISQDGIHPQQQSAWYVGPGHWDSRGIKLHDANTWSSDSGTWSGEAGESGWSGSIDHVNWGLNYVSKKVRIDGTDDDEERNWWDAAVREKHRRPGPGILPPLLEDSLHNPEHSLFSVIVDPPDSTRFEATSGPNAGPSSVVAADISRSSSHSLTVDPRTHSTFPPSPPSAEDLIHAVPHPNAYYCRRHNGWVILQWKESTVLPPLARSFQEDPQHPLPDQNRRKRTHSCIEGEPAFGQGNKTHHFHLYEKAVSAHKLTPAFYRQKWEMVDKVKQRRRKMTTSVLSIDNLSMDIARDDKMDEDTTQDDDDGDLLDLWVCCQCSLYCVASDVIPGVIPLKSFEEFTRNRHDNPVIGKNGEESVVIGWETLLTYVMFLAAYMFCRLTCHLVY